MIDWKYAGIMAAAAGAGVLLSRRTQKALPLSRTDRWGLALGAFCGAMIGAKLPFVLSDWEGLKSGAAWLDNGKTIVFGLVGGYFGVEIAKWSLQVRAKTGDTFAVPVATAVGIGRLACFSAGCCYGAPSSVPWAVDFGDGPRHPTQLYESVFHLTCALALGWLAGRDRFAGQRIKLYILAYLGYRFLTEFIRPEPRLWNGLTGYQLACVALAPMFALLWARDARARATSRLAEPEPLAS